MRLPLMSEEASTVMLITRRPGPMRKTVRTCECNLAPLCRRHHRAKQAQGWRLEQPEPGVMVWTLPHGRSYRVQPPAYPGDGAG